MALNFTQRVEAGKLLVDIFSTVSATSNSLSAAFTYTSALLQFDTVVFPSSGSLSVSSSSSGSFGSAIISASASPPSLISSPIATLVFVGSGTGSFNIDFSSLRLNGSTPVYTDPPAYSFLIQPSIETIFINLDEDGSYTGSFSPSGLFFSSSLSVGTAPTNGNIAFSADIFQSGTWVYTPTPNFYGNDEFLLTSKSGGQTKNQVVKVNVKSVVDIISGTDAPEQLFESTGDGAVLAAGGNDFITGNAGNDFINGGTGIDTASFNGNRTNFSFTKNGENLVTIDKRGNDGTDTLINIERLKFNDFSIALDISGNAGITVKILGSVFGKASVSNKEYVGIGLQLLDSGMSYLDLIQLAIDAKLGVRASNAAVVDLLYTNVVGTPPLAGDREFYLGMINSGAYTVGTLGQLAAETELNIANVNLVGLSITGLEYLLQA